MEKASHMGRDWSLHREGCLGAHQADLSSRNSPSKGAEERMMVSCGRNLELEGRL